MQNYINNLMLYQKKRKIAEWKTIHFDHSHRQYSLKHIIIVIIIRNYQKIFEMG